MGTKAIVSRALLASAQKSLKLAVSNKLAIVNSFESASSFCYNVKNLWEERINNKN